jgi:hypothetical protein
MITIQTHFGQKNISIREVLQKTVLNNGTCVQTCPCPQEKKREEYIYAQYDLSICNIETRNTAVLY